MGVADLRQDARHGAPDVAVVVDDEHAFGAWGGEGVLIVQDASRLDLRAPEPDPDGDALSDLAVDGDVAAQLMDDAEDLRQAQPRPLAGRLGGEERIERPGDDIGGHAASRILDRQEHHVGRGFKGRAQGDRSAIARHRIARVDAKAEDGELELIGVGERGRQVVFEALADPVARPRKDRTGPVAAILAAQSGRKIVRGGERSAR